jgi:hypothetical protein
VPSGWPTPGSSWRRSPQVGYGARPRRAARARVDRARDRRWPSEGYVRARSTGAARPLQRAGVLRRRPGARWSARATSRPVGTAKGDARRPPRAVRPGQATRMRRVRSAEANRRVRGQRSRGRPAAAGTLAPARARCVAAALGCPHRRHVRPRPRTRSIAGTDRSTARGGCFARGAPDRFSAGLSARRFSPSGVPRRG